MFAAACELWKKKTLITAKTQHLPDKLKVIFQNVLLK